MKTQTKVVIGVVAVAVAVLALLAWSPWITDDYAIERVVEKLGGSDARFDYLGQDMAVKDIPKHVSWLPFGRYVTFPSEAGWFVSFYGSVS
jgi:hypothetical protein